jgi:hypothetical protein
MRRGMEVAGAGEMFSLFGSLYHFLMYYIWWLELENG